MSSKTTYTCDNCREPIKDQPYGPLFVSVRGRELISPAAGYEFCGWDCAAAWCRNGGCPSDTIRRPQNAPPDA